VAIIDNPVMQTLDASTFARRALEGHASMCARFERSDGSLRRDGRIQLPWVLAHVWPFARAFVATLDVAGMPAPRRVGFDANPVIARRLRALERYWDERGPAYASDPPSWFTRLTGGGDIYHDDNAWAGLALVQLARQRPGHSRLDRAARLADFARAGWDTDPVAPNPGGVFWVQQGRGAGARNHDRNTVSTAPNGELILHLQELGEEGPGVEPDPAAMARWVADALGNGHDLFRDKIRGDGTIDAALWSYNQGSMLGLLALLSDRDGGDSPSRLRRAEDTARAALDHYENRRYEGEPTEFVAIFMRNLLQLSARTADESLRRRIAEAVRERADATWPIARTATLLQHSAAVSMQALAAWDPDDYRLLA